MPSLREKVEAELEQMDQVLGELPRTSHLQKLSVLELAGTACLLSSFYHGIENILKQGLLSKKLGLPSGAAWHRDLLQSACQHQIISEQQQVQLAPYMAFRHFFTHAYGFDLDPEKLEPLLEDLMAVYGSFRREIAQFVQQQIENTSSSKPGG